MPQHVKVVKIGISLGLNSPEGGYEYFHAIMQRLQRSWFLAQKWTFAPGASEEHCKGVFSAQKAGRLHVGMFASSPHTPPWPRLVQPCGSSAHRVGTAHPCILGVASRDPRHAMRPNSRSRVWVAASRPGAPSAGRPGRQSDQVSRQTILSRGSRLGAGFVSAGYPRVISSTTCTSSGIPSTART